MDPPTTAASKVGEVGRETKSLGQPKVSMKASVSLQVPERVGISSDACYTLHMRSQWQITYMVG